MRIALALLFVVLTPTLALAQQAPQQQTPEQQALGNKLMIEIGAGLQCQGALIAAQRELDELRKKHEEKPSAAPPPAK